MLHNLPARIGHRFRYFLWKRRLAELGEGSLIYPHVVIHTASRVQIGRRVAIAEFVHMWGGGGISIGDNSILAAHVIVTSQSHDVAAWGRDIPYRDTDVHAPVIIEENCWIGTGAIILPGVRLGRNCVIGAGAVVTREVPEKAICCGNPARVRRYCDGQQGSSRS